MTYIDPATRRHVNLVVIAMIVMALSGLAAIVALVLMYRTMQEPAHCGEQGNAHAIVTRGQI